ncbi:MAG: patatin-like phospholipase family protein [Verrucomicrobiae bacterium]|nr:patatin-like phospholipase family protein [Verrucomicrobiae bacterium]
MKAAIDTLIKTAHRPVAALRGWLPWGSGESNRHPRVKAERPVEAFDIRDRPTIGVALSSGGAKGLAHIGVIQVLEESGIEVDAIAGTSMGAYVAAMWASGLNGEELEELAATVQDRGDLFSLVDPVFFPRRGFIQGRKIERRLRVTLGDRSFREMVKPLYILATEFEGFRRRVLHEGDVASAVLASIAIPGIVVPVTRDGIEYVDGGVCDPLPVGVLREMAGVDHIIAVNVLPTVEEFHLSRQNRPDCPELPLWKRPFCWLNRQVNWFARGNILDTLRSAAMASQMQVVEHSAQLADVSIRPVDPSARWHDYTSFRRYIDIGREAAQNALPEILALSGGQAPPQTSETESKEALN